MPAPARVNRTAASIVAAEFAATAERAARRCDYAVAADLYAKAISRYMTAGETANATAAAQRAAACAAALSNVNAANA